MVFRIHDNMKYDEGMAKGISIGKAEGISIGKAEGISIGKAEGIISTARDFGMSDKDIISRLASKLHIPAADARQMLLNYAQEVSQACL